MDTGMGMDTILSTGDKGAGVTRGGMEKVSPLIEIYRTWIVFLTNYPQLKCLLVLD